jgi:hypothetical protein
MGVKNGIAEAIWRHANGYSWRKPATVDTPPAALKAADALVELYEGMNNETVDAMHRRFTKECKKEDTDTYPAHSFGALLAHVALRTSRQAMIEALFEVPHFQVSLENGELAWEGGADDDTYSEHEVLGRSHARNPSGQFTAKGERMYEDVRAEYEAKGDPRARELAARTVYARAADGVPGLVHRHGKPPGVPNGTRKPASVVTASWGPVHVGDVVEMPADREHGVRGGRATVVALHPGKNWDVTVESRGEEYDLNAGRLLRLVQKA